MKQTCDSCGAALTADDRFCGVCGRPQGPSTLPPLTPPPDTLDLSGPGSDEPKPPTPYATAPAPTRQRANLSLLIAVAVAVLLTSAGLAAILIAARGSEGSSSATAPSDTGEAPASADTASPTVVTTAASDPVETESKVAPTEPKAAETTTADTTPSCPREAAPSVVVDGTAGSAVLIDPGIAIDFEEVRLRVNGSLLDVQQPNRDGTPTYLGWMSDIDDASPDVGVGAYEAIVEVVTIDGTIVTACPLRFDVREGALVGEQAATDPELPVKQLSRDAILRFDPTAIATYVASGDGPGNLREGYGDTVRAVVIPLVDGRDALLAYQRDKCEVAGADCADNRRDPTGVEQVEVYCGDFAVSNGQADFIFRRSEGHTSLTLPGWPRLADTIVQTYEFCGS